jgi:TolA-binding protein
MRLFLIITLCICGLNISAQSNSNLKIANKYANSKQCEKANEIYKTLETKVNILSYYSNYLKCLLSEEKYTTALTLVKKARKKYPLKPKYIADLGFVYKAKGDKTRAEKEFKKSLDALEKGSINQVTSLANSFSKNKEYQWLFKTYQKGQELNPNYEFGFQLASSLSSIGKTEEMIDTYLDLVEKKAGHLKSVKIRLQNTLGRTKSSKDNYDLLSKKLLSRVQKTNNNALTELLVWLYIQSDEYSAAYIFTKALDKRLREQGERMFDLAYIAYENKAFDDAVKSYQYLIDLGTENPYYFDAKISQVIVIGEELMSREYSQDELVSLDKKYQLTIEELGKSKDLVYLMKDYAKLQAYHLFDTFTAIKILEECIGLLDQSELQAECKLMLGDIYLINNKDWDAIIQYSQVEKAYKENPIGHEAKFRCSRVAYFQGQFDWAQAQLDVLKGSTTKLIANNAMKLSLLITDNMGLDTSAMAMEMYAKAEWLIFQNKIDESYNLLDSMLTIFEGHTLSDEILYKQAEIQAQKKNYPEAAALYEQIATNFSFDILADDALFHWAELLENKLDNKTKAQELYEKIMLDYSDSIYTVESRKRYRNLRGDQTTEL